MGGDRPEEGRHPHGKKVGTEMNEVKREVLNGMEEQRKVGLQECRHLQVVAEPAGLLDSVRSRLEIFGVWGGSDQHPRTGCCGREGRHL